MVYKRYKGRRLRPRDKEWNKGKWVVEFMLKGNRILRAVPHARNKTEAEAEQRKIQSQIDGGFYCSTPALFSEFVVMNTCPGQKLIRSLMLMIEDGPKC